MNPQKRNWLLKYSIEWLMALIAFIVILPLLIMIIVLQQLFDSGPIFYFSSRLGRNGNIFTLYKFRSMKNGSKEIRSSDNKLIVLDNDSRISRFGKFLRLGFDELPQLLNVIKGEMCLVGPRPDIIEELNNYSSRERKRLLVLPGITGLTQVLNGRSLSNKDNYEIDVRYVEDSTLFTDILILLFTIPYSFGKKNIAKKHLKSFTKDIDFM